MTYENTKKVSEAKSNLTADSKNYRISYKVTDLEADGTTESISATIHEVTTTGEGDAATETLTRVGSGYLDITASRNYVAIEKHSQVSMTAQAAIVARYWADCADILGA